MRKRARRDSNLKPVVLNYVICSILNQVIGLSCHRMSDPFCKLSLAYFWSSLQYLNCRDKSSSLFGVDTLLTSFLAVNKKSFQDFCYKRLLRKIGTGLDELKLVCIDSKSLPCFLVLLSHLIKLIHSIMFGGN
jgi:hypothetical protein